jgi:DNA repair protein RadC
VIIRPAFFISMENNESKRTSSRTPHEFKVMRVRECAFPAQLIDTPERAVEYWRQNIIVADWFDECKEALVVLVLNTRRRIIGHNLVTLGNLESCFVRPLEIFRPIIVAAGSACILAHNHPSGDPTPSEADIKVTRDLIRAGQLLKIEILDHVIVGSPGGEQTKPYCSLREMGFFT